MKIIALTLTLAFVASAANAASWTLALYDGEERTILDHGLTFEECEKELVLDNGASNLWCEWEQ